MATAADARSSVIVRRSLLTYSQLSVWRSLQALAEDELGAVVLTRQWPVPPGVTIEQASQALADLQARHDALRARFEFEHEDEPRQVLTGDPEPGPWEIVSQETDGPVPGPAGIDLRHGPAWRAALVVTAGVPVLLILSIHHLIADAAAIDVLHHEFLALLQAGDLPPAPSPFDLADLQRSTAWEGRRRRAIDQWVAVAKAVSPDGVPPPGDVPRWASLRSVPALRGAALLAQETRTSVATVVLAAFCRLLAAEGAGSCFGLGLLAGNRVGQRWRSLVCTMDQLVPMIYQHDETVPLGETVRQVHRAAVEAYSNGSYDIDEVAEALAEHGVEAIGEGLAAFFNWINTAPEPAPAAVFDASDPAAWLVQTSQTGRDNGVARFLKASAGDSLLLRLQERVPTGSFESMTDELTWLHYTLAGENPDARAKLQNTRRHGRMR